MNKSDYSGSALIQFLEFAGEKGLINPETARSRRTAVSRILAAANEEESSDVRTIDKDALFGRFQNLNSQDFKPESLGIYKSRFGTALADFLRWKENPAGFRSSSTVRPSRTSAEKRSQGRGIGEQQWIGIPGAWPTAASNQESTREFTSPLIMPIPLTGVSVMLTVTNIPLDLTKMEAEKVKRVIAQIPAMIEALAVDGDS